MNWKDIHITTANILTLTAISVLGSTFFSLWWACGNGPEEVLRMWTLGSAGFLGGSIVTIVARHYGYGNLLSYSLDVILRSFIIFAVITTALLKLEGHYYNYSYITQNSKLADLEANSFANAFYGFSPGLQSVIGAALIAGLILLAFHKTKRIATIVLGSIFINTIFINYHFDSCYLLKNSIILGSLAAILYNDLPDYLAFLTNNSKFKSINYHPTLGHPNLKMSIDILKGIMLAGLLIYNHSYIEDITRYKTRNLNNPIAGIWFISNIKFYDPNVTQKQEELANFKNIILDNGNYGAIEVNDTLSFFEYLINPEDRQLELWNFQDFREMDIKGRYHQISSDSLLFVGRYQKDSLEITFKKITENIHK